MREDITIYCIRHGETDWNAEQRYQGTADVPMNEKGRSQAKRNGEALRTLLPAIAACAFVASPLQRSRETMEIVRTALGLPPDDYRTDHRLREVHYGHWEGQLLSDLKTLDPNGLAARKGDPYRWRPDGGESYSDLMDRVVAWLETIEQDTVIATHGGVSRMLRGHFAGEDMNTVLEMIVPQDRVLVIGHTHQSWL